MSHGWTPPGTPEPPLRLSDWLAFPFFLVCGLVVLAALAAVSGWVWR